MTDALATLEEYSHWTIGQAIKGWDTSPAEFMRQKHTARILAGLAKHLLDPRDDRYPLEEYLEVEDIDWILAQAATGGALDRVE